LKQRPLLRLAVSLAALGLLLSGPGCASYRLGNSEQLPFASVHVEPVVVQALVPQAQAILTSAIQRELDNDSRLVRRPAGEAEATLRVRVVGYRRDIAATRPEDTALARKLNLVLEAEIDLLNARSGEAWIESRPISVRAEAYVDGGQVQAETEALPVLARELAAAVRRAVGDVW
jgi:hypothetical protein